MLDVRLRMHIAYIQVVISCIFTNKSSKGICYLQACKGIALVNRRNVRPVYWHTYVCMYAVMECKCSGTTTIVDVGFDLHYVSGPTG